VTQEVQIPFKSMPSERPSQVSSSEACIKRKLRYFSVENAAEKDSLEEFFFCNKIYLVILVCSNKYNHNLQCAFLKLISLAHVKLIP
jgi:hypothetical protein